MEEDSLKINVAVTKTKKVEESLEKEWILISQPLPISQSCGERLDAAQPRGIDEAWAVIGCRVAEQVSTLTM